MIKSAVSADNDPLISPAIINYERTNYLYHVRAKGYGGDIVLSRMNDKMEATEIKILKCNGLPKNFLYGILAFIQTIIRNRLQKTVKFLDCLRSEIILKAVFIGPIRILLNRIGSLIKRL